MGIFNEFFKKEKPFFTGSLGVGGFGFGSGGGGAAEDSGPGLSLSGGNVEYTYNGNKIHVFTSPGTIRLVSVAVPGIKYVLIGGGGGCASDNSGGGGAGGVVTSIPGLMPSTRSDLDMTVGQSVTGGDWCWRTSWRCRTTQIILHMEVMEVAMDP